MGKAGAAIGSLLRRIAAGAHGDSHLSDGRMADLLCGEMSAVAAWRARRHLALCRQCRLRREQLEGPRAARMLRLYRDSINFTDSIEGSERTLPEEPRAAFAQWLQLQARQEAPRKRRLDLLLSASLPRLLPVEQNHDCHAQRRFSQWGRSLRNGPVHDCPFGFTYRDSALASMVSAGIALGLLLAVSVYSLWQQRAPAITANALLVRAESWDAPAAAAGAGVVHQTIRIRTPRQTIERTVYRDAQQKRRLLHTASFDRNEQLRSELSGAGIDWDEPISASAYRGWHDRQHVHADRVTRTAVHLLTLTTTVPDGAVAAESLTVRDTDFHPVERTVDFRDSGTVEIAELEFHVMPWSAVGTGIFEPLDAVTDAVAASPHRALSLHLESTPSAGELDETELAARLILNQLHADAGEQMEIRRLPQAVEVDGLVETDERKRELSAQLLTVPHLRVSIQSAGELRGDPAPGGQAIRVESASLPDRASELETYLRSRGRDTGEINEAARQLFSVALTISQESKAIDDLQSRYTPTRQLPLVASATLAELIYSHHERLEAAVRQERTLLDRSAADSPGGTGVPEDAGASPPETIALADAAAGNLALARELTQTNAPAPQSAETTFTAMRAAVDRVAAAAHQAYAHTPDHTTLSGNR